MLATTAATYGAVLSLLLRSHWATGTGRGGLSGPDRSAVDEQLLRGVLLPVVLSQVRRPEQ